METREFTTVRSHEVIKFYSTKGAIEMLKDVYRLLALALFLMAAVWAPSYGQSYFVVKGTVTTFRRAGSKCACHPSGQLKHFEELYYRHRFDG